MSLILDGTNGVSDIDGTAATPAIRGTDANTGIFFPAADTIAFSEGGTESMRIDSDGDVGIGTTSPATKLHVSTSGAGVQDVQWLNNSQAVGAGVGSRLVFTGTSSNNGLAAIDGAFAGATTADGGYMAFNTRAVTSGALTERMRIHSSGNVTIGKTAIDSATAGCLFLAAGEGVFVANGAEPLTLNRNTNDGTIVSLRQGDVQEGSISVSGTTVSYNGGHLSRWSQLLDGSKDDAILKGTVLSNLDDMCVWEKDGVVADNEQLNKMKVSDVEGDTNVAGVFVNWTRDEDCNSDDMNIAMTGDMIIRIADGVVVQKGDLLMSAGDGTAKPQGDDIVRSKTIAKVTSNYVTCTYEDGSYCVPCVLMAC